MAGEQDIIDGRRAGHNRWQESRTYEKYQSIRWAEISTWQDIWEIPWHQIVGDKHLTFYASYLKNWFISSVMEIWYGWEKSKSPIFTLNAYNLLYNCHFNCGNRPFLRYRSATSASITSALNLPLWFNQTAQQPTSFTDGAKLAWTLVEPLE